MQKIGKLNSSIDIIPLQGTSDSPKNMRNIVDNRIPRDPRVTRDPLILSRVQTYMHENDDKVYIDVNEMADSLQKRYRDYRTKKRIPFRAMVRRAYDEITESYSKKSDDQWNEDDDDEVEVESDPPGDTLSRELIKLYRKSRHSRNGNSSDKELIDISSDDDNNDQLGPESVKKRRWSDNLKKSATRPCTSGSINPNELPLPTIQSPGPSEKVRIPVSTDDPKSKKRPREKDGDNGAPNMTKKKKITVPTHFESKVKFANIGGSTKVLETVCRLLVHMRHPEIFKQLGISSPRGFLLHGPPGCGKTLLAHAIAGELGVPLIKVAAPELVAGVSGESESRIRELFEQALAVAPCVLFLDEVDAVATHRATAQKEMERRIVAQLLSCLDDLSTKEHGETVLVLGATNRPDALDPALRRAGRFDREISLGIPDKEARMSILAVHAAKLTLAPDINLSTIASLTPGFVGADLVALLTEAAMAAVNRVFDNLRSKELEIVEENNSSPDTKDDPIENGMEDCIEETEDPKETVNNDESLTVVTDDIQPEIIPETKEAEPEESIAEVSPDEPVAAEAPAPAAAPAATPATPAKPAATPAAPSPAKNKATVLEGLLTWLHHDAPLSSERLAEMQIEFSDFETALRVVQPSSKREGFATVPDVTWNDVGSLQNIRQELQMAILAPVKHSERFAAFGLNTPTGVLLCGPPGCGKTLLAKAIANEAGINFISVKGPELLNMYVGESEKAVRQCFIRARNSAPCVIFFDELDALCPKRSDGDNNATSRVVNQMLTEMDGVEGRKGVYLMAASNRPDIIDPAVLRPGRLDKILYVGLPTADDRIDILKALTKNGTKPKFAPEVNFDEIGRSSCCEGYSGADLASLVREAATEALRESMTGLSESSTDVIEVTEVSRRHIDVAFDKVRPSVHEKDAKHYEKLRKLYSPALKTSEVVPMDTPVETAMDSTMEAMET